MKALLLLIVSSAALAAPKITLKPERVKNGETSLIRIEPAPEGLKVKRDESEVTLFECPKGGGTCGFIPVAADTAPGSLELAVTWDGGSATAKLAVKDAKHKTSRLTVDPSLTQPSEEDKQRIDREREEIASAFATASKEPLFSGPFTFPCKGKRTSNFGNRRTFNGEVKSIHQGVDFRARTGTPIVTPNAGRVLLAKDFFFAGGMVAVDHGLGIISSYAHLSKIEVEPGQKVKKGQRVGKSGATGRSTGPHLHWAMRIDGVAVDPTQFRELFNKTFPSGSGGGNTRR